MFISKKTLSALLILMLLLSLLAGCGTAASVVTPPVEEPVEEPAQLDEAAVLRAFTEAYYNNMTDSKNNIPAADVLQMIADTPDAIMLLDMRTPDDYNAGHLPGAYNVTFATLVETMKKLPTDRQIIVYCYGGQNSSQGVAALRLMGFNALNMLSGMNFGWAALELGADTLESEANQLGAARDMNLTPEQEILYAALGNYFTAGVNHITPPDEIHQLLESNPDAITILDIRAAVDFAAGHIEGAINIPLAEVGRRLEEINKEKPVYIFCYSGQTAGQTQVNLRINGFNSFIANRAMLGWNNAELPVVTE